jgi:mono/diheme cytochrome c family protein
MTMKQPTTVSLSPANSGLRPALILAITALVVSACGGGASTESNPAPVNTQQSTYTGPAPAFPDVQSFRVNLWENIRGNDRCGACHNENDQAPQFGRGDDVNLAYSEALGEVNLENPVDSRLSTKVGSGHNCWLGTDPASVQACANIMTTWIENWANSSGAGGGRQIVLTPPLTLADPGASKAFPESSASFAPVHDLLVAHCAECHTSDAEFPQAPYFGSADRDESYAAAKAKINLDRPAESRFVQRLRNEFHNCWTTSCASDADIMQAAIAAFADPIPLNPVNPQLVNSKAVTLLDGIVASGGNRFEDNQIALWEFKSGTGTTAFDTSGVDPAINLQLEGNVTWVGGYGINILSGQARGNTTSSRKLYDSITPTGEYAIEAWVAPSNVTQEEAFIVSYSGSNSVRNFTLGQTLYSYDAFNRSSETDENGTPALTTAAADEDLQATLQHVVVNFDPVNGRTIYVNGVNTGDVDPNAGGSIASWRDNFAFVLGNETSGDRQWQGVIRLVAVHNRALTPEQIMQNFDVGVGQKFFLLFNLADHITDIPDPYLVFEVSQFDSFGYLFNKPRFISLDASVADPEVRLAGMRIGINGAIAKVGQVYTRVDTTAPGFAVPYTEEGMLLSPQGGIVPVIKGPDEDEFFISFEVLGDSQNVFVEAAPTPPGLLPDGQPVSDIGLRTFDEINLTMANITTVSTQQFDVLNTYQRVKQQLPTAENFGGFLAANQMAIAQLSIEYCNALVNDTAKRASFWPGVNFDADVNTAFGSQAARDLVFDPLLEAIVLPDAFGVALPSQPTVAEMRGELDALTNRLTVCSNNNSCEADRTETVVKAVCGAALGNAAMLVQ